MLLVNKVLPDLVWESNLWPSIVPFRKKAKVLVGLKFEMQSVREKNREERLYEDFLLCGYSCNAFRMHAKLYI